MHPNEFLWIFVMHCLKQTLRFVFRNHSDDNNLKCQGIGEAKVGVPIEGKRVG